MKMDGSYYGQQIIFSIILGLFDEKIDVDPGNDLE